MKICLIGADGQLGSDLGGIVPAGRLEAWTYPDFDVTRPEAVRGRIKALRPEVVINTSAFHRVDECEEKPHEAFLVNALAVRDLALACREAGAVLVHFSTDYVFDGRRRKPYDERDAPNPLSAYAVSKLAGEFFLRHLCPRHVLIRTCGLYGRAGSREKGTNFVESIVSASRQGKTLRIVSDQTVTPTSTAELAPRVLELVERGVFGLFHMTNEGQCSWFEFARAIVDLLGLTPDLQPVSSEEYGAKASRPSYSVLENRACKRLKLTPFSHWRAALAAYLRLKGHLAG